MLHHWDFNPQPVSAMAADYLASICDRPLLCIGAVNPGRAPPPLPDPRTHSKHRLQSISSAGVLRIPSRGYCGSTTSCCAERLSGFDALHGLLQSGAFAAVRHGASVCLFAGLYARVPLLARAQDQRQRACKALAAAQASGAEGAAKVSTHT